MSHLSRPSDPVLLGWGRTAQEADGVGYLEYGLRKHHGEEDIGELMRRG